MKLIKSDLKSIELRVSTNELHVICQALNVICKEIDLFEFETRMGVYKEEVLQLIEQINQIIIKNK